MHRALFSLVVAVCVTAGTGSSQTIMGHLQQRLTKLSSPLNLPDAPSQGEADPVTANGVVRGTNEILKDDAYEPLTKHQKWIHFVHRTYASATFMGAAENTVFDRVTGGFIYCCGVSAWGKQYGSIVADTESRQFFGNFLFPTLLRQDPRYFPKRTGGMFGRAWYAATRVLVTRNDSGTSTFNYSEVLGVAFSKALSNAYYPDRMTGGMSTTWNILGTFQSDATTNLLREFWPDIRRVVHKHTPKSLRGLAERLPLPNAPSQY